MSRCAVILVGLVAQLTVSAAFQRASLKTAIPDVFRFPSSCQKLGLRRAVAPGLLARNIPKTSSRQGTRVYVSAEDPMYRNMTENIYRQRVAAAQQQKREVDKETFRLLPLFPLHDEVVFPDGRISLRLFEERYIKLFSTILAGEEEIDPQKTDEYSPYFGSGRFGIVWRTPGPLPGTPGALARTGVAMRVVSHEWMGMNGARDQLIVNCQAYKRFKVDDIIRSEPVVEALVTPIKEKILPPDRVKAEIEICRKLIQVCDTVRKLSAEKAMRRAYFSMEERMRVLSKLTINEQVMMQLTGEQLSYWVATHMYEDLVDQQEMLQLPTPRRLRYQLQTLSATRDSLLEEAKALLNNSTGAEEE
eukprot:CAMPEP_0184492944 /NCGR_PEP_ID=MMETSP0113_2-20130426/24658_1 /TAXON_ID=91329 /ORGANISM="Norrisiella sphaerica, Strain BC52" /LENGTH=360 /DNA_ID=CAMNT_0026878003 /DNA_START=36 /DNA_END=1121 /DNA_ORIENTATION=-